MNDPTRDAPDSPAGYDSAAIGRARLALDEVPETLGRYRIRERIGGGGMGEVYVAEQTEPIRRRVAVKVIKAGMDTRQVVARFEAERQALAMMDHPNIAKVFDAGTTDTGRPYFVMELVRGVPITKFADDNKLTTRQRVELLVPICQAVQHAHQKGVIHRDIKPHNVLVTLHDGKPVPKVIDFGIAKATSQPLTDKTVYTEFRQMIGTPAYMSPEQAEMSGLDIDTRSDIYSLGVLAYELLTGTPPFDSDRLVKAGLGEIQRIIREEEPPRPSLRFSTMGDRLSTIATHRGTEPARLSKLVAGELDWIVMRAMEKDRRRRYDTATDLAADFNRHLNGEPVVAAPPTWGYRTAKFIRRNKGTAITAAAVGTSLTIGLAIASWEAYRANQERAAAERAETQVEADVEVATKTLGEMYAPDTVKNKWSFGLGFAAGAGSATDMDGNPQTSRSEIETLAYYASRDNKALREKTEAAEKANRIIEADRDLAMQTLGEMDAHADPHLRSIADRFDATDEHKHQIIGLGATIAANMDDDMQIVGKLSPLQVLASRAKDNYSQLLQQRDAAELEAYTADLALAQSAMASGNWPEARARLDACPESKRGWEWQFLQKQATTILWSLPKGTESIQLSKDGKRLLTRGYDNREVRLWDAVTGRQAGPIIQTPAVNLLDGTIVMGASSPDCTRVLQYNKNGGCTEWDTRTGEEVPSSPKTTESISGAEYSPDGRRILVVFGTDHEAAQLFDVRSGEPVGPPIAYDATSQEDASFGRLTIEEFTKDGRKLLLRSAEDTIQFWDVETQRPSGTAMRAPGQIWAASVSPDGSKVAVFCHVRDKTEAGRYQPSGQLWDLASGTTCPLGNRMSLQFQLKSQLTFSLDGNRLAYATVGNGASIWDVGRRREAAWLPCDNVLGCLIFSPDASRVATAGWTGEARVWNAASGDQVLSVPKSASHAIFTPDGDKIVTWGTLNSKLDTELGALQCIKITGIDGVELGEVDSTTNAPKLAGFAEASADGGLIYLCSNDLFFAVGTATCDLGVDVIAADSGEGDLQIQSLGNDGSAAPTSQRAPLTAVRATDGGLEIADPNAKHAENVHIGAPVTAYAFTPDGSRIVTADGTRLRFDQVADGRELVTFPVEFAVKQLQFTPDGTRLIVQFADGSAQVWDPRPLAERRQMWARRAAERTPARAYVAQLLATAATTRPADLRQMIRDDPSITPLRKLAALEVLDPELRRARTSR